MNGQFQLGELQPIKYFFSIALLVGLLFGFIAPDDEPPNGWLILMLQWQLQTVVPMFLAIFTHNALSQTGLLKRLGRWAKLIVSGLLACALFSPIALLSDYWLANENIEVSFLVDSLDEFTSITPPIVICWLAINAPFQFGWRLNKISTFETQPSEQQSESPYQENSANFMQLVPEDIRGNIIYLKSELHYLQVVTDKGKALILYSLKNAIAELDAITGVQSHRSYWVNPAYVSSFTKSGREGTITLLTGDTIPVSRSRIAAVKDLVENRSGLKSTG